MRINVSEENSDQVLWFKERFLGDEEIIEHFIHNPTRSICWTIHKPKRGWYIRLRHPSFSPGIFIPFIPVPPASPYHIDAALSFSSQTTAPSSHHHHAPSPSLPSASSSTHFISQDDSSRSSIHSYPPTPPTVSVVIRPPSPSGSISPPPSSQSPPHEADVTSQGMMTTTSNSSRPDPPPLRHRPPTLITQFILAPLSISPQVPTTTTFITRALSMLKSHRPSHSRSFTLSRVPVVTPMSPPPPYSSRSNVALMDGATASPPLSLAPPLVPLLVLHDRTPVLTIGSFTGLIELDHVEERTLGVDRSFWIAVALTYLEFLEERESYLAAQSD
ncbi:hypothetical protein AMATHDRAFT_8901 [Amanita thiersii Skay4041]|uniref:Uncharacterized protein n=1 Tax=Amanita thiersii Skay4041 TaxID=703135 RepID=A0A2A9ND33_9AGAR|nr:hypothetical protein AMATHDRAFT_8901 [Amanita thiersii Skay4041]